MAQLEVVSSADKKKVAMSFTESEIDVARQLVRLCREKDVVVNSDDRLTGADQDVCSCYVRLTVEGFCGEDDEIRDCEDDDGSVDVKFRPRKRRFRSIDIIYRSTEPLELLHLNARKIN